MQLFHKSYLLHLIISKQRLRNHIFHIFFRTKDILAQSSSPTHQQKYNCAWYIVVYVYHGLAWHSESNLKNSIQELKNCFKILFTAWFSRRFNCKKWPLQNFQSLEINKNGEINVFGDSYCTRIQLIATI